MHWRGVCGLTVLALLGALQTPAASERQPIAIVVSAEWETPPEIQLATLRRLYMGRITRWAGQPVERYDLASGTRPRVTFTSQVMGLTERELEDYWLEQALSGGAIPPREVDGMVEMRRVIASRAGRIGYLPLAALESGDAARLRVLAVSVGGRTRHPREADYPIDMDRASGAKGQD